jgi:GNAT superfamily N-acetyltransferase
MLAFIFARIVHADLEVGRNFAAVDEGGAIVSVSMFLPPLTDSFSPVGTRTRTMASSALPVRIFPALTLRWACGAAAVQWKLVRAGILKFPFLFGAGATYRLFKMMNYVERTELVYGKGTLAFWRVFVAAAAAACWRHAAGIHPWGAGRYLDYAAVLHTRQGQGIGSLLLKRTLEAMRATEEFRAQRLPFLLTTSDPRNVPFYQRLGFEVSARVCACSGLPLIRATSWS